MTLDDETVLDDFARDEDSEPSPRKQIDSVRTIYGTRKLRLPRDAQYGQPVLCDFGEARIGTSHKGLIQPEIYRAPEVLFDMGWGTSADMWNVAALVRCSGLPFIQKLTGRLGISWRISISSTPSTRMESRLRRTTSLK